VPLFTKQRSRWQPSSQCSRRPGGKNNKIKNGNRGALNCFSVSSTSPRVFGRGRAGMRLECKMLYAVQWLIRKQVGKQNNKRLLWWATLGLAHQTVYCVPEIFAEAVCPPLAYCAPGNCLLCPVRYATGHVCLQIARLFMLWMCQRVPDYKIYWRSSRC